MGYDIKTIKEEFKSKGIYHTPEGLSKKLRSYFPIDVSEVYDPTCGTGNLLSEFSEAEKYGQDIDSLQIGIARERLKNFHGIVDDVLKAPAWNDRKFKAIVANYPFSVKWEPNEKDERFIDAPTIPTQGKADYAFLLHILHYLDDSGGIAVTLNFPGILYRGQREGKIRKWIVDNNWIDTIEFIPGDTFVDTKIATVIIVFKKNKKTTDITFISGDKQRIVPLSEVVENNYTLTENNYFEEEYVREVIDVEKVELEAQRNSIELLKSSIEMSMLVLEVEDKSLIELNPFLDEIQSVVDRYREVVNAKIKRK